VGLPFKFIVEILMIAEGDDNKNYELSKCEMKERDYDNIMFYISLGPVPEIQWN